jgi:ribosomal protein S18 acetylase RimI-like enzyme
MDDFIIRKFEYTDIDDFIRLSQISFAEESIAAGLTPDDFERETRRIFRWRMVPYKVLTRLMGIQWEGFVAEKDGKVVGGGMFIGRDHRMTLTNLMVEPACRRQGIGQALLAKRLERLRELGYAYVTTQVLDTNIASLGNLGKQNFEVYHQYSVYEHSLPLSESSKPMPAHLAFREIKRSDRAAFREIEKKTTPADVLQINGSAETRFFLSMWQKLYYRYARYQKLIRVVVSDGRPIGFICAEFQHQQRKGFLLHPIIADEGLQDLPAIIQKVGTWLEGSARESMVVEIPDERIQIRDHLVKDGWKKRYTWLELIKRLK